MQLLNLSEIPPQTAGSVGGKHMKYVRIILPADGWGGLIQGLPREKEPVFLSVNPLRASPEPDDEKECLSLNSRVIKETSERKKKNIHSCMSV